jgi:hypothetical protein
MILKKHFQELNGNFEEIKNDHVRLGQLINNQKENSNQYSLIKQIDRWETDSIYTIKQTAENCRNEINNYLIEIENKFNDLTKELEKIHPENQLNEIDLNRIKRKLNEELGKLKNISIEHDSSTFINPIFIRIEGGEKNSIRYSF